jgi:hypothetical protein
MSHGASCAGSELRSALYEAKMGKRMIEVLVVMLMMGCSFVRENISYEAKHDGWLVV